MTYLTIIKQPLSFKYSIQATMNRIILNHKCKDLVVEGINDNIFVDGNTLFSKITYYNDFKKFNFLGFHYDFIYGIKAKTFRIKELNLYNIDDNGYYSSLSNKYVSLETYIYEDLEKNLNRFLCIAKKIRRIAILPKLYNKKKSPLYKSYVSSINILTLEVIYGKDFREPSFLENKKTANSVMINKSILSRNNVSFDELLNVKEQLLILSNLTFSSLICIEGNYIRLDSKWQKNNTN